MKRIYLILILLTTMCCSYCLDKKMDFYTKGKPIIYDIGHHYLPHLNEHIANIYLLPFLFTLCLPNMMYPFIHYAIPIFVIRLITIHLTVLPKHEKCIIDHQKYIVGGCYDKIFSGHFAIIFLITLLLWKNKYISIEWLVLFNVINAFLIISTRSHYTIDVFIAFLITWFVWKLL